MREEEKKEIGKEGRRKEEDRVGGRKKGEIGRERGERKLGRRKK